ncbi:unnamed protein product, partial [Polarella glacialis]
MVLTSGATDALIAQYEAGKPGLLRVMDALTKVNSESAEALVPDDAEAVKSIILSSSSFSDVDNQIKNFMLHWMASTFEAHMKQIMAPPGKLGLKKSRTGLLVTVGFEGEGFGYPAAFQKSLSLTSFHGQLPESLGQPWAPQANISNSCLASRSVSPQPRFTQMQGVLSAGGQPPQWTMSQPTMSWPSQQQYPAWQQPPSGVASRSASPTPGQPGAAGGDSRYLLSVGPSRSVSPQPGSPFGGRSPWGAQPVQGGRTAVPHPRSVSPMQRVGGLATPVGYLSQGGGFGLLGQSNTPGVPAPAALPLQPGASGSTTPQGYFSSLRGRPGSFGLPLSQAGAGVGGVPCPNPMPCGQRLGGGYGNQFGAAPSPMSLLLARGHPGQPGGPCSQPAVAASPSNRVSPNGAMERFVVRQ